MLRAQQAPWLLVATASTAGELTSPSFQRFHLALRRWVLQPVLPGFAPGADCQKPELSYEQIFRIAA